ncbi:hypothetical protein ACFR9U_14090 [Halorientalis brevis]|uniref:Uncharacterized protein n=1 Tax=Halorientalis brevis TaxID=1126241 RepID=A0ABD6CD53_9EURY|nr:hypothetical protein [Halorientalis brevis]
MSALASDPEVGGGRERPSLSMRTLSDLSTAVVSTAARTDRRLQWSGRTAALSWLLLGVLAVDPVLAQSTGSAFCSSDMAETARNVFTVIQFGGPLIGGTVFLGATVAIPVVRRSDLKKEFKELRNQGLVWGVLVAPLATVILQFLLNNVVAGGSSCGF